MVPANGRRLMAWSSRAESRRDSARFEFRRRFGTHGGISLRSTLADLTCSLCSDRRIRWMRCWACLSDAIASGQLHIHAEIAVQIRLGAVEIEIADRNSAQIAADARINGL